MTATLPKTDSQGSGMLAEELNPKTTEPPIYNLFKDGKKKKSPYLKEAARSMVLQISSLPEASRIFTPKDSGSGVS